MNHSGEVSVRIVPWSADDLPVLERSNTPEMTEYLGGPESPEKLVERQWRFLRLWDSGEARMFTIRADGIPDTVGSVGYWTSTWHGAHVYESGWSVATAYQGRGFASRGLAACLNHAADHGSRDVLVAFPRIDNGASNALCRSLGFELSGVEDFEYPPGNPIQVNAWRFDLAGLRATRRRNGQTPNGQTH
jgi:RimJ/RimL family protein N-acetyltransferase